MAEYNGGLSMNAGQSRIQDVQAILLGYLTMALQVAVDVVPFVAVRGRPKTARL